MADILEVTVSLAERAVSLGVPRESVLIDPGHDFGKNTRPSQADTAVVASVPSSRSLTGRSSVSPTKSLLDSETSTGQPVSVISPSRRVASRLCRVFLPKSCPGSISTDSRGTPSDTARSASETVTSRMSAITSS